MQTSHSASLTSSPQASLGIPGTSEIQVQQRGFAPLSFQGGTRLPSRVGTNQARPSLTQPSDTGYLRQARPTESPSAIINKQDHHDRLDEHHEHGKDNKVNTEDAPPDLNPAPPIDAGTPQSDGLMLDELQPLLKQLEGLWGKFEDAAASVKKSSLQGDDQADKRANLPCRSLLINALNTDIDIKSAQGLAKHLFNRNPVGNNSAHNHAHAHLVETLVDVKRWITNDYQNSASDILAKQVDTDSINASIDALLAPSSNDPFRSTHLLQELNYKKDIEIAARQLEKKIYEHVHGEKAPRAITPLGRDKSIAIMARTNHHIVLDGLYNECDKNVTPQQIILALNRCNSFKTPSLDKVIGALNDKMHIDQDCREASDQKGTSENRLIRLGKAVLSVFTEAPKATAQVIRGWLSLPPLILSLVTRPKYSTHYTAHVAHKPSSSSPSHPDGWLGRKIRRPHQPAPSTHTNTHTNTNTANPPNQSARRAN